MDHTFATIISGLAASLCWGSGDFSGGLASRSSTSISVIIATYTIGLILLVGLAWIWKEQLPSLTDIIWGTLGALAGVTSTMAFYGALAIGRMGVVAPVSAVMTAGLPVLFSTLTQGIPGPLQIGGFVLALLAIGLISRPERSTGRPKGIGLALLAGCGFGCFFILSSRVSPGETFWPLAAGRLASVILMLVLVLVRRQPVRPKKEVGFFILLAGVMDAVGNAFFVLAAHTGRLDVASILSSLYPAATVLLAACILRERVTRIQS